MQGEILEGLVARVVTRDSSKRMKKVLKYSTPHLPVGGKLHYASAVFL